VVVAFVLFAVFAVLGRGRMLSSRALEDILLGVATAALVAALLRDRRSWIPSRSARAATWLAGFSYSLYLFHYPSVAFVHAFLVRSERWTPNVSTVLSGVGITFGIALLWCYPLSLATERHTQKLRSCLARSAGTTSDKTK
jgi:peptidoglycan/LPS O-acetylase OafA/YrhL